MTYDPPLDKGIERAVHVLNDAGVETFESCQGGDGHAYVEPTIRFHGDQGEGYRALAAALSAGLRVVALRRTWCIHDNEPTGPYWEMVFPPIQAGRRLEPNYRPAMSSREHS